MPRQRPKRASATRRTERPSLTSQCRFRSESISWMQPREHFRKNVFNDAPDIPRRRPRLVPRRRRRAGLPGRVPRAAGGTGLHRTPCHLRPSPPRCAAMTRPLLFFRMPIPTPRAATPCRDGWCRTKRCELRADILPAARPAAAACPTRLTPPIRRGAIWGGSHVASSVDTFASRPPTGGCEGVVAG